MFSYIDLTCIPVYKMEFFHRNEDIVGYIEVSINVGREKKNHLEYEIKRLDRAYTVHVWISYLCNYTGCTTHNSMNRVCKMF